MIKSERPTLKDVARYANVSTATVSFVLNASKRVSPQTRTRVEQALTALGYRISLQAVALRTGRHKAIGLILPDLLNPFFSGIAQAVTQSAWAHGHAVILAGNPNTVGPDAQEFGMLEERVDGIIWIPDGIPKLRSFTRPLVILDRTPPNLAQYDSVSVDHYAGGVATAALVRDLGRKQVGILAGPTTSRSAQNRLAGFIDHAQGLNIVWHHEAAYALELSQAILPLLGDPRIDVVVAANDIVAISVLRELRALKRNVPNEVALIGFDDIPWAALTDPPLTTFRQPLADLGNEAVTMLLERICGHRGPPRNRLLPVSVVHRGTTAPRVQQRQQGSLDEFAITHCHSGSRQ